MIIIRPSLFVGHLNTSSETKCFAFELAGRKQSEAIFPFANVCILYEVFPKWLTLNGKSDFCPANLIAEHFSKVSCVFQSVRKADAS
jgi:hypothetical protein